MSRLSRGLYVDETQRANNRIVLSNRIGAGVAMRKAAMHELTHYIEGSAGYDPYKEAVLKAAYRNDTDGNLRAADESRIQETYANAGIELDETTIEKELLAEATEKIISDPDGFIVQQILDSGDIGVIARLKMKLQAFLARRKAKKEGSVDAYDAMRTAQQKLSEALRRAGRHAADPNAEADATIDLETTGRKRGELAYGAEGEQVQFAMVNPGSHYDYSKPFAEQVDDYFAGKIPHGDSLILRGTPDIYLKIGFSNLPMTINTAHIEGAVLGSRDTEHSLSKELLSQLPDLLKNPIAVIESKNAQGGRESSVVSIVKAVVNGKPAVAPIYITSNSYHNRERYDTNSVSTVFRKKNGISLLTDAINSPNGVGVYYINKTEAQSLLAGAGVQFPGSSLQDGLNHSIFDAGSPVNRKYLEQTETRQFKRWFGKNLH